MSVEQRLKDKYSNYVISPLVWPINVRVVETVAKFNPEKIMEFGCNNGKNLRLLRQLGFHSLYGLDMSESAIMEANKTFAGVQVGTDKDLPLFPDNKYDVVFTCSVLNHIPDVSKIIPEFQRIAKKAVVLAETQDVVAWNYWAHDYASYGFTDTGYEWKSIDKGQVYRIWVWEK